MHMYFGFPGVPARQPSALAFVSLVSAVPGDGAPDEWRPKERRPHQRLNRGVPKSSDNQQGQEEGAPSKSENSNLRPLFSQSFSRDFVAI